MVAERVPEQTADLSQWLGRVHCGDALEFLRGLPDNCCDSVITDPPSGIRFMGKSWDSDKGGRAQWVAWLSEVLAECYRVAKPGATLACWALPRTSHWTGCAVEDAGWEVFDCVSHVFSTGFPKSKNFGCKCRGSMLPDSCDDTTTTETSPGLPTVRGTVLAEKSHAPREGQVLQRQMRGGPQDGTTGYVGEAEDDSGSRAQRMDGSRDGEAQGEDDGGEQPFVEGRGDVLPQERELQADQVCPVPPRVLADGPQGWVRDGASADCGAPFGAVPITGGSSSPQESQPPRQQPRESGVIPQQQGPQDRGGGTCQVCGGLIDFAGYGTGAKPSHECWWLARKPCEGSFAANAEAWGVSGLNVDGCRIGTSVETWPATRSYAPGQMQPGGQGDTVTTGPMPSGRYPSNTVFSHLPGCVRVGEVRVAGGNGVRGSARTGVAGFAGLGGHGEEVGYADADGLETVAKWECAEGCAVAELARQSGERRAGSPLTGGEPSSLNDSVYSLGMQHRTQFPGHADKGTAARFFQQFPGEDEPPFNYIAKSSRSERERGLIGHIPCAVCGGLDTETHEVNGRTAKCFRNSHPTVKSVALMTWLATLTKTPTGGVILEPFAGSGTTCVAAVRTGRQFIGCELDPHYTEIANRRIDEARRNAQPSLIEE